MTAETLGQIKTAQMLSPRLATTTGAMLLYVERGWEGAHEHMKSVPFWKERHARSVTGTEISTLPHYSTTRKEPHLCSSYC